MPCQVAVAPRITCRFGTWGSCCRRRRSSGYQPSSGFGALPGSLFPVCLTACPVEWRLIVHPRGQIVRKTLDYPPFILKCAFYRHWLAWRRLRAVIEERVGGRESCRGAKKPPAGAPVTRGEYGEVVERITEETVLGRVAMIACFLWAKCGHHPSFSWPMPRRTWRSSNRNRARVDIPLCTSATTAGYARFPALIVH